MNSRYLVLAIAAAVAFPVAGYAQESGSTITRAGVRRTRSTGKHGLSARSRQ
jgi:hypothetical protein